MNGFKFYNPTEVYFGQDQINKLANLIKQYGKNVLLVYGKGSIVRMGLYDRITKIFEDSTINWIEIAGIDPNPRIESVREGAKLCKENNVDFVLAVGGGSVIDASKAIASAALYDGDPWDFYARKNTPTKALPIGVVLTLAATGSEMNPFSVITNLKTKEKRGWSSPLNFPKFSILDPTYTMSVPSHQTACGIVDSLTHIYEFYFSTLNFYLNNRVVEGIMKTIIHYGPKALENPNDFEARANLMFSSTLALNGISGFGQVWDGFNHSLEHVLSAYYDIAHADGLSILAPHWMRYVLNDDNIDKFKEFAINVWDIENVGTAEEIAKKGIDKMETFYKSIGMPTQLSHVGITDSDFNDIANYATKNGSIGNFVTLSKDDVLQILYDSL
jgi:alcohol dehydrogenase YqhD (iron-dependent ADH family)